MPRRRRAKAETTLVPHRTPDLAALLDEAKNCELAPLRRYLAAGGQPNALVSMQLAGGAFTTLPLLYSALFRSPHLTDYASSIDSLLDAGADINACFMDAADGVELSLLMCACQYYTSEPMAILLQRGADACLQTPSVSLTALHIAARCGSTDKCKLLPEANRRAIELRSCDGKSPLFEAAWGAQLPVVKLLHKDYGGNLFTTDEDGATLLHAAVQAQLP
eukprot:20165-Heterococcus_DN1.PRE.1